MVSLSPPGPPLVSWACPKAATARFAKLCSQDFRPPVHPRLASAQATSPRAQRESTFSPHPSAARGWPPTPSRSLLPSRWPSRGDGAPWLMWEGHAPQRTACFMKGQGRRRDSPKAPGFAVTTRHVCAREGAQGSQAQWIGPGSGASCYADHRVHPAALPEEEEEGSQPPASTVGLSHLGERETLQSYLTGGSPSLRLTWSLWLGFEPGQPDLAPRLPENAQRALRSH